jgi:hypothetical protein
MGGVKEIIAIKPCGSRGHLEMHKDMLSQRRNFDKVFGLVIAHKSEKWQGVRVFCELDPVFSCPANMPLSRSSVAQIRGRKRCGQSPELSPLDKSLLLRYI